jgi:hypothetical protein
MLWIDTINSMRAKGITFAAGLTSAELDSAEKQFDFRFPQDYAEFLGEGLPVGERFPDWRRRPDSINKSLVWPWEGMAFDIEQNSFWLDSFGTRPPALADALRVAKQHFDQAPKLIPIYSHRFIPSDPPTAGNPIYSVYQMDIIYYGSNLREYLEIEFLGKDHSAMSQSFRPIRFWDDVT